MAERRQRKSSGEHATAESKKRAEQNKATAEKQKKALSEGQSPSAIAAPSSDVPRQDRIVLVGAEVRDGAEIKESADQLQERALGAFDKAVAVDVVSVAGTGQKVVVGFDAKHFELDTQQVMSLRRQLDGAAINLNPEENP